MSDVIKHPALEEAENGVKSLFGTERLGHSLIVMGRLIPNVVVFDRGDRVEFIIDGRLSSSVLRDDAQNTAFLLATAMAIGSGYAHIGAPTKDRPFAPEVRMIEFGLNGGDT